MESTKLLWTAPRIGWGPNWLKAALSWATMVSKKEPPSLMSSRFYSSSARVVISIIMIIGRYWNSIFRNFRRRLLVPLVVRWRQDYSVCTVYPLDRFNNHTVRNEDPSEALQNSCYLGRVSRKIYASDRFESLKSNGNFCSPTRKPQIRR